MALLAAGCAPPSLALDEALVGVWIDTTGKSRLEIAADGQTTLWSYEQPRILRGKGARLVWENERRMTQTGDQVVQMPLLYPLIANRNGSSSLWHSKNRTKAVLVLEGGKWRGKTIDGTTLEAQEQTVSFDYAIVEKADGVHLTLKPRGGPGHEIRLEKLQFGQTVSGIDTGDYEMHRQQATAAELSRYAAAGDASAFEKLLAGTGGAFLVNAGAERASGEYPSMAVNRLYGELARGGNADLLDTLLEHAGRAVLPADISATLPAPVIELLRKRAGLPAENRDRRTLSAINHLLHRTAYAAYTPPFVLKLMYEQDGCSPLNETAALSRAERGPFSPEERAALDAYHEASRTDGLADQRAMEAAMTACLRNFQDGQPVASDALNGLTSPGYMPVRGITTPLYYFASRQIPQRNPSAPEPYFGFTYSLMKAMVNAGADPSMKPTPEHASLIDYLHEHAPDYFDKVSLEPGARLGTVAAELVTFNELMDLLGGPHYGQSRQDTASAAPTAPPPQQGAPSTPIEQPAVVTNEEHEVPPAKEVIGYWDYDGVDGTQLVHGLVLRDAVGSGLGQTWSRHLELKTHANLPPRQRTLWPVLLLRKARKVCVDYPNYPTYDVHVDMLDDAYDGVYRVGPCGG